MAAVKTAAAGESRLPGRSRAVRTSCSCTHVSVICARSWSPNVVRSRKKPAISVSRSTSRERSWDIRCWWKSASSEMTLRPVHCRRAATSRSTIRLNSLRTSARLAGPCGSRGRAAKAFSVATTLTMWSLTVQPGHSVGFSKSSSRQAQPRSTIAWTTCSKASRRPPWSSGAAGCRGMPPDYLGWSHALSRP